MGRQQRALLSVVVAGILIATVLGRKASADQAGLSIQNVQATNVTDRGFFVNWTTDQSASNGAVLYGTSSASVISLVPEVTGPRADVHRVLVQPANPPGTTIYYDVKSGTTVDNNGGTHYRITLGQALGTYPSPVAVSGQVLQSDGRTPAVGVLVTVWALDYQGLDGVAQGAVAVSAPLSVLTDSSGNWSTSLETRLADGTQFFKYTTNGSDQIKYSVSGGSLGNAFVSNLSLLLSSSGQVAAPPVSLISGSVTPTPTLTVTTGPVPTNTGTATLTPANTALANATIVGSPTSPAGTMVGTSTVSATAGRPPAATTIATPATVVPTPEVYSPTPIPPTPVPRPAFVPTAPVRPAHSPTSIAPLPTQASAPIFVGFTPTPFATVLETSTLFPPAAVTRSARAWPDRSTPTPTPTSSPSAGAGTSGHSNGGAASGQTGLELPAGVGLLLIIGTSFIAMGALGVAVAVLEGRRVT